MKVCPLSYVRGSVMADRPGRLGKLSDIQEIIIKRGEGGDNQYLDSRHYTYTYHLYSLSYVVIST